MSGLINLAYKTSAGITKLDEVNYSSASDEFKEVSLKASNGGNVTYAYTTNDSTYEEVTPIHIKKDGQEYHVISKYILPIPKYEKVTFDKAGTYTWTCPKGVTEIKITLAGAGGGNGGRSYETYTLWSGGSNGFSQRVTGYKAGGSGGNGEIITKTVRLIKEQVYTIHVGKGGAQGANSDGISGNGADGENTTGFSLVARGGGGGSGTLAYAISSGRGETLTTDGATDGISYGQGGKGGTSTFPNGQDGWCIIEYGTDIQGTSTPSSPKPGFGYDPGDPEDPNLPEPDNPDPEPPEPDNPEPDNPTPDD